MLNIKKRIQNLKWVKEGVYIKKEWFNGNLIIEIDFTSNQNNKDKNIKGG